MARFSRAEISKRWSVAQSVWLKWDTFPSSPTSHVRQSPTFAVVNGGTSEFGEFAELEEDPFPPPPELACDLTNS